MILYLFVTLLEKRNRLIEKYKECGGYSNEILSNIREVEMDILKHKVYYFGHVDHGDILAKKNQNKVLLYSPLFKQRFVPEQVSYALQ